ncbi:MAG: Hsp20/alpha crystallin family protein [Planctomycetes bacterium]|nr:Hsp20/alpha crystallin family protein [Planctomycetota bacterium]
MAEATLERNIEKKTDSELQQQGVEPTREGRVFVPATDIRQTNEAIVLTADMPGVRSEGVEITLADGVLTVRGTLAEGHRREGAAYAEYDVGDYQRSFSVSDAIDHDGIEAKMANGVLTLTLPKKQPRQKRIEVK